MADIKQLTDKLKRFVESQHMFFVATAPSGSDGHVNLSPKGFDGSLVFLEEDMVAQVAASQGVSLHPERKCYLAYLDIGGSGIETCAHLQQNGRITVMFCAFEGPPKIVRMFGRGLHVEPHERHFETVLSAFSPQAIENMFGPVGSSNKKKIRNIVIVEVTRIRISCGKGVPIMKYERQRTELTNSVKKMSEERVHALREKKNTWSLDGLKGLRCCFNESKDSSGAEQRKAECSKSDSAIDVQQALLWLSVGIIAAGSGAALVDKMMTT